MVEEQLSEDQKYKIEGRDKGGQPSTGVSDESEIATTSSKKGVMLSVKLRLVGAAFLLIACVFAFLPWLEISPTLLGSLAAIQGLLETFGSDSTAFPTLASYYSVFSLGDIAQLLSQAKSIAQALGSSSSLISISQDVLAVVDSAVMALYVLIALWVVSLICSLAGMIWCAVSKGTKGGLLIIGASLLFAVSSFWACLYNTVMITADQWAGNILAGASLSSIICAVLSLIAWVFIMIAAVNARHESKKLEDLPGDVSGKGHQSKPIALIVSAIVLVLSVVFNVVCAVQIGAALESLQSSSQNETANASDTSSSTSNLLSSEEAEDSSGTERDFSNEIAATVDGAELSEQAVIDYIAVFRETSDMEDDDSWISWLKENGYTSETVREEVINYYTDQYLLELACEENSVTVTTTEIDNALEQTKSMFESEAAFEEALDASNMTEEEYIEAFITPNLRMAKLMEATEGVQFDDDEALAEAYNAWVENYRSTKDIQIYPMPAGLPYAVF